MPILTPERRAVIIGKLDAMLTFLFTIAAFAFTEFVAWAITALPQINTSDWGRYNWAKIPVSILIAAFLKGIDRKRHEDPTPSTGLIEVPRSLTNG